MLPSKGYFKSLNCPYFECGFCNRPHCHFRHIRAESDDLLDDVFMESSSFNSTSSDSTPPREQSSASVSYKPTPISELKKRHLPVNSVPSATVSPVKRKIEPYNVRYVRRPKEEYRPEGRAHTAVYKATKISDIPEQSTNSKGDLFDDDVESPGLDEDEGSIDETDIEKVTKELNVIGEILKLYENGVSLNDISSEITSSETTLDLNSEEMLKTSSQSSDEKHNSEPICNRTSDSKSVEAKQIENSGKSSKDSKSNHKISSSNHKRKLDDAQKPTKDENKTKESSIIIDLFDDDKEKEDLEDKSNKQSHHHSSSSRKTGKENKHTHTTPSSSKHSKTNLEHSKMNPEHLKNEPEHSKKYSEHKHSSSSSSKKNSNHSSSTSTSSSKDSLHRSSSKSSKKDSDTISTKDKEKSLSKNKSSHSKLSRSKSKNKEETKYQTKEKGRTVEKEKQKSSSSSSRKSKASESEDEVEIISDTDSIIVIDSDDEKEKKKNRKRKMSSSEKSILQKSKKTISNHRRNSDATGERDGWRHPPSVSSSPDRSPYFPSDDSITDEPCSGNEQSSLNVSKTKEINTEIDMRVMSKLKSRVSLGNVWRPQTKLKKPVKLLTPAQRLMQFRKMTLEIESENSENLAINGKLKISGVPNVQNLLLEKQRLNCLAPKSNVGQRKILLAHRRMEHQIEDPDNVDAQPEPLPIESKRTLSTDKSNREYGMRLLWEKFRHLVKPGESYKTQRTKCQIAEKELFQSSQVDEYYTKIGHFTAKMEASEIPKFTQEYFRDIKPPLSKLFPVELNPDKGHSVSLYDTLIPLILTQDQLKKEGYPRKRDDFEETGLCYIEESSIRRWCNGKLPRSRTDDGTLICRKCGKEYDIDEKTQLSTTDCYYHGKSGKIIRTIKVTQEKVSKHICCMKSDPCMYSKHHSTEFADFSRLEGFLESPEPCDSMPSEGWGILAMDCEMYWSTVGLQVGRVSLVNVDYRCVYDAFIRNEHPVSDFMTSKSGITKDLLDGGRSFDSVREDLFQIINSKTILIGHSLDNDLKVMKMIHNTVIDTSVLYERGPDKKWPLQRLANDKLGLNVQNDETAGHSSIEDSVVCMRLVWKYVLETKKKPTVPVKVRAPPSCKSRNVFDGT